jgi:hypothetical protein
MRMLVFLLTLLTLTSCSTYAPGEDQKGVELQNVAQQVLAAIQNYMDDNSRPPRTLQDLVPKYLKALPAEPLINYDLKNSRLDFMYQQEGKTGSQVACHAVIGETDWVCTGIYKQRQ